MGLRIEMFIILAPTVESNGTIVVAFRMKPGRPDARFQSAREIIRNEQEMNCVSSVHVIGYAFSAVFITYVGAELYKIPSYTNRIVPVFQLGLSYNLIKK